jgi:hypothetical protein
MVMMSGALFQSLFTPKFATPMVMTSKALFQSPFMLFTPKFATIVQGSPPLFKSLSMSSKAFLQCTK